MDGVYMPCDMAMRAYSSGAAAQCPNNDCGPRVSINYRTGERSLTSPFMAYADGTSGFYRYEWNKFTTLNANGTVDTKNSDKRAHITGRQFVSASQEDWADKLIRERIKIFGFDEQQTDIIKGTWRKLLTDPECVNAFKEARSGTRRLATPEEILRKRGYTFMTIDYLETQEGKKEMMSYGFSNEQVNQTVAHFNLIGRLGKWYGPGASTIGPVGSDYAKYPDQRILTVVNPASWFGYPLKETIVHETIHGAGVPPIFTIYGNDLTNFSSYDKIIEKCSLK